MDISRRDIFKLASASGLVAAVVASKPLVKPLLAQEKPGWEVKEGEMIYRQLGRTGEKVSLIGLGGHHIGRPKEEQFAIAKSKKIE